MSVLDLDGQAKSMNDKHKIVESGHSGVFLQVMQRERLNFTLDIIS